MAFWIYMLRCSDGRYYIGHTDALERRVAEHQAGQCGDFTRRRRPVELVWSEQVSTRLEALEGERKLKGWTRAKKEALIQGNWGRLSWLAVPPGEREARASTSLSTNGCWVSDNQEPFVLSEVEGRSEGGAAP